MRATYLFLSLLVISVSGISQSLKEKLGREIRKIEADTQMRHAIIGFCVKDSKTGKIIFDHHAQIGLAPASTQKIITSVAVYELLGKNYRYKTDLAYEGNIKDGILNGNLYLLGTGDPTLGSWRWPFTRDSVLLRKWMADIKKAAISRITGTVLFDPSRFSNQSIPDGWIWQDIGNYYGAGANVLNWKENQFDLILQSGAVKNSRVSIVSPRDFYVNELKAAAKGSGDNAYAYLPIGMQAPLLKGTIPVGESSFTISLAEKDPVDKLLKDLRRYLEAAGIHTEPPESNYSYNYTDSFLSKPVIVSSHFSPPFDSVNYYFLQKSINLYGEALLKALAYEKTGFGSTEKGIEIVQNFFGSKGIDKSAIAVVDGSGLSPQNRVTADAMVRVLEFAKKQSWFPSFYKAFPVYNGIKMKSGSIGGVRAFSGYHQATNGNEYSFSIIINNFDGPAAEIVKKMYKVLDLLK